MAEAKGFGRLAAFAACVCGFTALASVLRRHFGFPLDDSWIHQTVARNLVETHVLGYLPGVHSSGSSSLLWTLVLAFQYQFLPGVSPVVFSAVVNGLLLGLVGAGLKWLGERDGMPEADSWMLAVAPALSGNFLWFGLLGMEHVLFVALSVGVIGLWFAGGRRRAVGGAALLLGLLTLTRPEGLFLAGVLLVFRRRAGRSWGEFGGVLLGALVAQGISFRVNWVASHTLLPLTMKGRQWLWFAGSPIGHSARIAFAVNVIYRVTSNWTPGGVAIAHAVNRGPGLFGLLLLLAGCTTVQIWFFYKRRRERMSALLLWMLGLAAVYMVELPNMGHGGRYQPLLVLLVLPLLFLALRDGLQWVGVRLGVSGGRAGAGALVVTVLVMGVSTAVSYRTWRGLARDGIDQINQEHGAMGVWVRRSLPAEALAGRKIAVFDIGRIGYGLRGNLVDLGGLTDTEYLPYLMRRAVPEYLRMNGIEYVVLPTTKDGRRKFEDLLLPPQAGTQFALEELKTICFSLVTADRVMAATGAALPCQTAYRLRFGATR